MNKITQYLNQHLAGNVFDKPSILEKYATDRSIVKVTPRFVALPANTNDIRKLVIFANQLAKRNYRLPIAVRGSGLDKTGADLSSGMVISTERLNRIQEIDPRERLIRVQAGVTLGQLNSALATHGLTIPINADPRETIGGLISNRFVDSFTKKHGGILNFVERLEVVTADGNCLQTSNLRRRALRQKKSLTTFEGGIYRAVDSILTEHFDSVAAIKRARLRNAAGYPGIALVRPLKVTDRPNLKTKSLDLAPLFFGAQGTLGIISEVILRAEIQTERRHLMASLTSTRSAVDFMNFARTLDPAELNIYHRDIIAAAEPSGNRLSLFTKKFDTGWLIWLTFDDSARQNARKIQKLQKKLPKTANAIAETPQNTDFFRDAKSCLSSYLNDSTRAERAPLVDDFFIPRSQFAAFAEASKEPIFGSYLTKTYSVRPEVELATVSGRQAELQFIKDFAALVQHHHGQLVSGSPEGRVKAFVTNPALDEPTKHLYQDIKTAFDPNNIFNPEAKLGADARALVRNLRVAYIDEIVI